MVEENIDVYSEVIAQEVVLGDYTYLNEIYPPSGMFYLGVYYTDVYVGCFHAAHGTHSITTNHYTFPRTTLNYDLFKND